VRTGEPIGTGDAEVLPAAGLRQQCAYGISPPSATRSADGRKPEAGHQASEYVAVPGPAYEDAALEAGMGICEAQEPLMPHDVDGAPPVAGVRMHVCPAVPQEAHHALPRFRIVAECLRGGFCFHLGPPGPAQDRPIAPNILLRHACLGPPHALVSEGRDRVPLI